jgi:hypothetical protein
MIGSLAGFTGVPLVGTLLSIFGQVMGCFSKQKTPSEKDQLENLIRNLQSETKLAAIQTAWDAVNRFGAAVREVAGDTKTVEDLDGLRKTVDKFNPLEGPTINAIAEVCHWLEVQKNQDLPMWLDVLNILCICYSDLIINVVALYGAVSVADGKLKLASGSAIPDLEKQLGKLLSSINACLKLAQADFERQGQFLKNILPAARNRGTIWMIVYPNDRNHDAPVSVGYSAAPGSRTGPDLFVGEHSGHIYARDGVVTPREWIRIGGDFRSMSIARTRQFEPVSSRPH